MVEGEGVAADLDLHDGNKTRVSGQIQCLSKTVKPWKPTHVMHIITSLCMGGKE
jgi:hypothetical protein